MRFKNTLLCGVVLVSFAIFSPVAFAYDNATTHPALTNEIVEFYNLTHPNQKITGEERAWLIEGSKQEDVAPRWVNHFYDPVHKEGWTGEHEGEVPALATQILTLLGLPQDKPVSAVEWVNSDLQAYNYYRYGGDNTWKKALSSYVSQNKHDAYVALGHVLHLLEDMAVPDHTRNDTHANVVGVDEGSPYEDYATRYDTQGIKGLNIASGLVSAGAHAVGKATIEKQLASLAEYSNKYFFSKDTINDPKFEFPKVLRNDGGFGYGRDENAGELLLVRAKQQKDSDMSFQNVYLMGNSKEYYPIFEAYFSHLSKQAVLHGAGVIDLFYASVPDAEIARDIPIHLYKANPELFGLFHFSFLGELMNAGNTIAAYLSTGRDWIAGVVGLSHRTNTNSKAALTPAPIASSKSTLISKDPATASAEETSRAVNADESESESGSEPESPTLIAASLYDAPPKSISVVEDVSTTSLATNTAPTTTTPHFPVFGSGMPTTPRELHCAGSVAITEIMYDPSGSDEGREWIEIFNAGLAPVTLTDMRLAEGGVNHLIREVRGGTELVPGAYVIIANDGTQFVADHPEYLGPVFHSALSLPNESGRVGVKCGSTTADEVSYVSTMGARGDGNSLQRAGEWIAAVPSIGSATPHQNTIVADLSYTPAEVVLESEITFNATSSTCARCTLTRYEWDFGDGFIASSTNATTSHAYASEGDHTVTLAVTSDVGATSTRSVVVRVVPKPVVLRNVLVSEVQVSGVSAHDEFIELYNPNEIPIALKGYSIQYVSGKATSTAKASKKNFSPDAVIASRGFYLLVNADATSSLKDAADMTYSGFSLSGEPSGGILFLVTRTSPVPDARDASIADRVAYGDVLLPDIAAALLPGAGKSIERKANISSTAESMERGADMFLGNGYDTQNNQNDFVMRAIPGPQSTTHYSEPRAAPLAPVGSDGTANSLGSYSSSTAMITLLWGAVTDARGATSTIVYELSRDAGGLTKLTETASTSYVFSPVGEGERYAFALIAQDAEGLRSVTSTWAIDVPRQPTLFPQFSFQPTAPLDGDLVRFDASPSRSTADPIAVYTWDFGDAAYATTSVPIITHTYRDVGEHTAKLALIDSRGTTSTATSSVISVSIRPPTDRYVYEDISGGDVQMPYQGGDVGQYLGSGLHGTFSEVGAHYSSCCGYYPDHTLRIYEGDAYEGTPRHEIFAGGANVFASGWAKFLGATSTLNPQKHYWLRVPAEYASYPLHPGKGGGSIQYEYRPFLFNGDAYSHHSFIDGVSMDLFQHDPDGRMAYRIPVVQ